MGQGLAADLVGDLGQALELVVVGATFGTCAHIVLPMGAAHGLQEAPGKGFHLRHQLGRVLAAQPGVAFPLRAAGTARKVADIYQCHAGLGADLFHRGRIIHVLHHLAGIRLKAFQAVMLHVPHHEGHVGGGAHGTALPDAKDRAGGPETDVRVHRVQALGHRGNAKRADTGCRDCRGQKMTSSEHGVSPDGW